MARYCVDTNVFIEAKNGPYGFDIAPGFWDWVDSMVSTSSLYSPRAVYDELAEGNDYLAEWIKKRKNSGMFADPDEETQIRFKNVANYVSSNYADPHVATFLSGADPWVISQALADNSVVVTKETAVNLNSKKVKIPNICHHFGVSCINTYTMLRESGAVLR